MTTLSSNTTITQTLFNTYASPITISAGITVKLGANITDSTGKYFIIGGNGVVFDGSSNTITINNVTNYPGLISCSVSAYSATIQNLGILTSGTTVLNAYNGWVVQGYSGGGALDSGTTASNCYSTGNIANNYCGGIFGAYSKGIAINCYSTGNILGVYTGGIFAYYSSGSATYCYNTGQIGSGYSGGIFGGNSSGNATYCYSTGTISSYYCGGIFGYNNTGTASRCYYAGTMTNTSNSGGIIAGGVSSTWVDGVNYQSASTATASYCYSIGGSISSFAPFSSTCISNSTKIWSDTSATSTIYNGTGGSIWTDIDTTNTNVPWLLSSFNKSLYTNLIENYSTSLSSYTTSAGLFSSSVAFDPSGNTPISPTYSIISSPSTYTPTINSTTGALTFTNINGSSATTVLCYYNYNSTKIGYNISTYNLSAPTFNTISTNGILRQNGTSIEFSSDNGSTWAAFSISVSGLTINAGVTVKLSTSLTISSIYQFFVIGGTGVVLDGSGNTITVSGVSNYPGLVQCTNSTYITTIKNIGVLSSGSTLATNSGWVVQGATAVGQNTGVTVSSCYTNISITSGSGIFGNYGSGTATNCYSIGSITGASVGGIFGSYSNGTASNCYCNGTISGTLAGGIFGSYSSGTANDCSFNGTISGTGSGGIFASYSSGTANRCYSTGTISSQYSGGVFGRYCSGTANYCSSSSTISNSWSGGILGDNSSGKASYCYFTGVISGNNSGGIFSTYASSASTATYCYSTGTITSGGAGFIFGAYGSGTATSCFSTGAVNSANTATDSGAIFGYGSTTKAIAKYCYSTGTIGSNCGGIFGGTCSGNAISCYSTGTITTGGGIFARNTPSTGIAKYCYSTGAFSGTSGGIFGPTSTTAISMCCYCTGGTATGGVTSTTNVTVSTGIWSDSSAISSIGTSAGWTIIGTNVPWLLSSFNQSIYSVSYVSSTLTSYTTSSGLFTSTTAYTGSSLSPTYQFLSSTTGTPTINSSTGVLTMTNTSTGYNVATVLCYYTVNSQTIGYNISTFTLVNPNSVISTNGILGQNGSNIQFSSDNGSTWSVLDFSTTGILINSGVTVKLSTSLTVDSIYKYFVIGGTGIVFDGSGNTITVSSVVNYPGLIKCINGSYSATIQNVGVLSTGATTLATYSGWLVYGCSYGNYIDSNITANTCYSTGNFSTNNCGGIFGAYSSGTATTCFSTGSISSSVGYCGGIFGFYSSNSTATYCYYTGTISGFSNGGIFSGAFNCTATSCYSTGTISSQYNGGIFGQYCNNCTATSCYSTGSMPGSSVGGIFGSQAISCTASYCYSTGSITGNAGTGGIFGGGSTNSTANRCYFTGTTTGSTFSGNTGLFGDSPSNASATANYCYCTGTDRNGAAITTGCTVSIATWSDTTAGSTINNNTTGVWTDIDTTSTSVPWLLSSFNTSPYSVSSVSQSSSSYATGNGSFTSTTAYTGASLSPTYAIVSTVSAPSYTPTLNTTTGALTFTSFKGSSVVTVLSYYTANSQKVGYNISTFTYKFLSTTISTSGILKQNGTDIQFSSDNGTTWSTIEFSSYGATISSGVTLTLSTNLTISSIYQYFTIAGTGIVFDGSGNTITVSNTAYYPGLINCTKSSFSATIKNLGVLSSGSTTLAAFGGWVVQAATANGINTGIAVNTCYSTGAISNTYCGGIFGYYGDGSATNCYSTGAINNTYGGGIYGCSSRGNATNCYSTGAISGNGVGGIYGNGCSGNATNCYSTGAISNDCGGIYGSTCTGAATYCYSTGAITTTTGGGIYGLNGSGNANRCYSTGLLTSSSGGCIYGSSSTGIPSYCYSNSGTRIGGGTSVGCIYSSISWVDASANSTINNNTTGVWTDISTATNVPWLLSSFNTSNYSVSSVSNTLSSYTTSAGVFSSTTAYTGSSLSPTYAILSASPVTPTINSSTGALTFTTTTPATSTVSILSYYTVSSQKAGYNISTYTYTYTVPIVPGTVISASGLLRQNGTSIEYSSNSGSTWSAIDFSTVGATISAGVTLTLTTDLSCNSAYQYFTITGAGAVFDGSYNNITISSVPSYPGLIQCNNATYSATIQNLGVLATGTSTLATSAGWVVQNPGAINLNTGVTVTNCYSTGEIIAGGGIFGDYASGTATNCFSIGAISGATCGGICGATSKAKVTYCYSSGAITGTYAGGIFGQSATIDASANYCYSNGIISGTSAGGIFGSSSIGTANKCYSIGAFTSATANGIFGNSSTGTANYCYCVGGARTGGATNTTSIAVSGTWLDTSANSTIYNGTSGYVWMDIDGTTTSVPWLLVSFNKAIYSLSSETFSTTLSNYTTGSGLFSSTTAYTGVSLSPTYAVISATPTTYTPTIASNGALTFTSPQGTTSVNVLSYYNVNSNKVGYNISNYSLTCSSSAVPCFLIGTKIQTNLNEYKLVQDLKEGERVYTPDGRFVQILKIESYTCDASEKTSPYLIPLGYQGSNDFVCNEDLYLSPDHGVFYDNETIVPIKNMGFQQDKTVANLHYYHLTLPNFFTDHVVANGIACESYCGHFIKQCNNKMEVLAFMLELLKKVFCKKTFSRKHLSVHKYNVLLDGFIGGNPQLENCTKHMNLSLI